MVRPMALTFTIEHHGDGRIYLCADNGTDAKPIAFFFSAEDAATFADTLNATRMVSHTMGSLGI